MTYNRSAHKRVEIGAVSGTDGPIVFVRDHGIGIKAEDQERMFRMCLRLHPHGECGEGAGLAVAERIVERHGANAAGIRGGEGEHDLLHA